MAAPRQALGELEERDHVAERQPREHHDVERVRRGGSSMLGLLCCYHDGRFLLLGQRELDTACSEMHSGSAGLQDTDDSKDDVATNPIGVDCKCKM